MSTIIKTVIYILFIFTLFIGLFFHEDSAGGAYHDINYLLPYINHFQNSFSTGIQYYINNLNIHSPFYFIFISILNKLFNGIFYTKLLYIVISSILPFLFYQILKIKFNYNKNLLFLLSCIIFISPYFRSSAIWLLGDNLALIFYAISILFYLKFNKENKKSYFFICISAIIICCYIRYYYAPFYLFYIFYAYINFSYRFLFVVLIYSLIISLPAFFYLFLIIKNYSFLSTVYTYSKLNYIGNIFTILSLVLFYIIPFTIFDLNKIKVYYSKNINQILILSSPLLIIYFIDFFTNYNIIEFSPLGGGVFRKLIDLTSFDLSSSLLIISIFSILILNYYFKGYIFKNYILIFLFILSFPMFTLFQKYFDPLIFFFLFGLITYSKKICLLSLNRYKILSIYLYFFSFYFFSLFYYS